MDLRSALDTVLDRTVVLGYTSPGFRLRSQTWEEPPRMDGRVVVVTGATSGIGEAAARRLASLGARVWLVGRNRERTEQAAARVEGDAVTGLCDLSDLDSVRAFAEHFLAKEDRLDALVHNAGALLDERSESAQGIETTLATHVVGPFALTSAVLPALQAAPPSRVIAVSSGGMYTQGIALDDLQSERDYRGAVAYARAKRAQVVLTELAAERCGRRGIVFHAMHPGWADTPGVSSSLPVFRRITGPLLRSPEAGADTIVWLAAAGEPATTSGGFYMDRRRRPTHRLGVTRSPATVRQALWDEVSRLAGVA